MAAVDSICELHQRTVNKVAAVSLNDVEQAKAELQLRIELEERQIDVATHADFQIDVKRLESQGIMLSGSKVNHWIKSSNEIWPEIIESRCSKLHVERHGNIRTLEHLSAVGTGSLFVIDSVFLPEMNRRRKTEREVFVQAKGTNHTYREARAIVIDFRVPLFAGIRVDEAIVLQLDVLHVQAKEEAIMQLPLVDVRAVLHLALLSREAKNKG